MTHTLADAGGAKGAMPPPPKPACKKVIKKMAAEGGCIDFMFVGPPYTAAGCVTDIQF